jgi:hypothetical protein
MSDVRSAATPRELLLPAKFPFTAEEDALLMTLVWRHGRNDWVYIASRMRARSSRQCRERWINYLNPGLTTSPCTGAEDDVLRARYAEFGPKWVKLTDCLPNRSANTIKNKASVLERLGKWRQREAECRRDIAKEVPKVDDPVGHFFANTKVDIFVDDMSYIFSNF